MEKLQKDAETCAEETQATGEDISNMINHQPPATHNGKCMLFCLQKKMGIVRKK